jgi:hypothetical protein
VPLFNQLSEKSLNNFVLEYLEDLDHPALTHLPSTQGLLMRIGTRGTIPHGLRRPKEGSAMTQPTIQKIPEDHGVLPKA